MKRILSLLLVTAIILGCSACSSRAERVSAEELIKGVTPVGAKAKEYDDDFVKNQYAFGLALLKDQAKAEGNHLVSPLSAELALAMAANGAAGNTLSQLEKALGGYSIDELNQYLYTTARWLPSTEKVKLNLANSVWFRDSKNFEVKTDFLSVCAGYYKAELYKAAFDKETVNEVNGWVKKNTDGMIPQILESIGPNDSMYLLNALAFDAQWEQRYKAKDVLARNFTPEGAPAHIASLMSSKEFFYYEGEHCTGFRKDYDAGYAFVALLPEEGMSMADFLASLDAEEMMRILDSECYGGNIVNAMLPKFSYDCSFSLKDALASLGVTDAFGKAADFSRMSNTDLYLSGAIQITHIEVDESGARAAAATGLTMAGKSAPAEPRDVILDRPFLYIIQSTYAKEPVFMGIVMDVPEK